jgi:type I site-specific restriction endonuclease
LENLRTLSSRRLAWLLVALLFVGGGASAQERRSAGSDQALKRAQYMLRLLNQEKSELESQVAGLEEEKRDLAKEVGRLEAQVADTEGRLEASQEVNDRLAERIRSDLEKYKDLLGRHRNTVRALREANNDNQMLIEAVREREEWIDTCREQNEGLFEANQDLMQRYKDLAFRHTEGIFGIERVSYENEVQEYRFRIEDLTVTAYEPSMDASAHVRTPRQGLPEAQEGAQVPASPPPTSLGSDESVRDGE